jgi:broad specificity phosphatase PhoE
MRHAQPDFSGVNRWAPPGWPVDLAPLAPTGEDQVKAQIPTVLKFDPEVVITSPVTRALHTALCMSSDLRVPLKVEFDLREWFPDVRLKRLSWEQLLERQEEFETLKGEWPLGETRPWETVTSMRERLLSVFRRYTSFRRVVANSHQEPIRAIAEVNEVGHASLTRLEWSDGR